MKLEHFNYNLPRELIAQYPAEKRDSSRLLVVNKRDGSMFHRKFKDIVEFLHKGDALVLNDTKVIPARLVGRREGTGGRAELLLLERRDKDIFSALLKPSSKFRRGSRVVFGNGCLTGEILEREDEKWLVRFDTDGKLPQIVNEIGETPLPPYIKRRPKDSDVERYQTVYAKKEGAVAAPTAGLHFTTELLKEIQKAGAKIIYLTLHVGYGTFKPVAAEEIEEHKMHSEYFELSNSAAHKLNEVKANGGRVFAVGTTVCRVLEATAYRVQSTGYRVQDSKGYTGLFIYPPYKFKFVDALLTNFHLPKTTLLMLVSAFTGQDLLMRAYKQAIERRYRFYSYGDATLLL